MLPGKERARGESLEVFFSHGTVILRLILIDSDICIAVWANEGQGPLGPTLGLHLCLSPEDHTSQPRRTRIGFAAPQVAFKGVHVRAKT